MSFGQDLYLEGAVNEIAFAQTGDPTYLAAAQKWYQEGVALGPNRPQSLYGLFDVYRAESNTTDTIAIGSTILRDWPTDANIKQAMAVYEMMANSSATVATSTKK